MAQEWASIQVAKGPGATLEHRPDFTAGYPAGWKTAGEILASAYAGDSADVMVRRWLDSPTHRDALLNPAATHVGIGLAFYPDGSKVVVENFAGF